MAKFLGQTGLVYLWGKIKNYVSNYVKITSSTGKDTITVGNNSIDVYDWAQGSSKPSYTVDELSDGTTYKRFSATEQSKLNNISSGAEVNQNAFSNVKVGSDTIAADGKTDTLEIAAGSNNLVSLTADTTNDKVTIEIEKDLSKFDNTTAGFITSDDIPEGVSPYTSDPEMNGTASAGSSSLYAKGDHVHPSDTSRVAANTAITGATKTKITYDSKGLVTAGADLVASDIPSLTLSKISDVTATATELNVLDGITVSTTELNYVDGVTSAIQTQLNGKVASTSVGVANGVCPLDSNTKIDAQYLPSYVDDIIEAYIRTGQTALSSTWLATGSASGTTITPESGKIYVLMNSDSTYSENTEFRWGGSTYVKINDGGISEMTTAEMDTATDNWA